jgi:hypothetical protein
MTEASSDREGPSAALAGRWSAAGSLKKAESKIEPDRGKPAAASVSSGVAGESVTTALSLPESSLGPTALTAPGVEVSAGAATGEGGLDGGNEEAVGAVSVLMPGSELPTESKKAAEEEKVPPLEVAVAVVAGGEELDWLPREIDGPA